MRMQGKVEGSNQVLAAIVKMSKKYKKTPDVMVGFTQSYAVYVHENLQAHHPVGQAKFLESAAKALKVPVGKLISRLVKQGVSLLDAALAGGLMIQKEAQKRCPVDTGALRASAFTASIQDAASAAAKAFKRSNKRRGG